MQGKHLFLGLLSEKRGDKKEKANKVPLQIHLYVKSSRRQKEKEEETDCRSDSRCDLNSPRQLSPLVVTSDDSTVILGTKESRKKKLWPWLLALTHRAHAEINELCLDRTLMEDRKEILAITLTDVLRARMRVCKRAVECKKT